MNCGPSFVTSSEMRGASEHHHEADADGRRDRSPLAFPPDDLAARFFDKLGVLASFGLASHTRLLLETPRQEG